MRVWLLLMILASCAPSSPPPVFLISESIVAQKGVEAWANLGFYLVLEDTGLGECDRTWYSDTFEGDCQITIRLHIVPNLTDDDVNGAVIYGRANQDTRLIEINADLKGQGLQHTITHEIGHILLDSMHLESYPDRTWGGYGVMSAQDYNLIEPTVNDYALACYTIGFCYG